MISRWAPLCVAVACAGPSQSSPPSEPPPAAANEVACEPASDVRVRGECLDPTGERDAAPALARILSAMRADPPGLGTPLPLPENAVLRIDDADGDGIGVQIDRRVLLEGRGAVLRVTGDFIGVRLTAGANMSTIRDLTVEGRGARRGGMGLDVRAHGLRVDNLWIHHIHTALRAHSRIEASGTCEADADCATDGVGQCREGACFNYANVNSQRWANVVIRQCDTGVSLRGGDANAGLFSGFEILSTPNAIVDDSFLGNVFIAPVMETATAQSIALLQPASYSTVVGGYIERNSVRARGATRSLFVGGNAANYSDGGERIGMQAATLTFRHPESQLRVRVPGSPNAALMWRHPSEQDPWHLRFFMEGDVARWGFSHRGDRSRTTFFTDTVPGLVEWRRQHPLPRGPAAAP